MNTPDDKFLRDMQDLFARRQTAHIGQHLYDNDTTQGLSGSDLWQRVAENSKDYYVSREAYKLLHNSIPELTTVIPPGLILRDLGPGAEGAVQKTSMPLVQSLKPNMYVPVDISEQFVRSACAIVERNCPEVSIQPEIDDLEGTQPLRKTAAVTYYGGGTIGNVVHPLSHEFPSLQFAMEFKKHVQIPGDILIVGYDGNNDESSLIKAYSSPEVVAFFTNVFNRAARTLPHQDFSAEAFKYQPVWNVSANQIAHMWRAEKDLTFKLGEETFEVKNGEQFHLLNSYKPSESNIRAAADFAHMKVIKIIGKDSKSKIVVLQHSAEMYEFSPPAKTRRNVIREFAYAASFAFAAIGLTHVIPHINNSSNYRLASSDEFIEAAPGGALILRKTPSNGVTTFAPALN